MTFSVRYKSRFLLVSCAIIFLIILSGTGYSMETLPKRRVTLSPPSPAVQKLLDLIPDKTGFLWLGVPERPDLGEPINFYRWTPEEPWTLKTPYSDLVFPNDKYPEDKAIKALNPLGQMVEYPYYEGPDKRRYFFTAHIWYQQRNYVIGQVKEVAKTDPGGAARILYKFAQVYPGYCPVYDMIYDQYPIEKGPPYPVPFSGKWARWYYAELLPVANLAEAFAEVRKTDAFDKLSQEVGEDVEYKIEHEMIRPSVEFLRTYPIANTNMDASIWQGLIRIGKALDEPDYVHEAVERLENFVENHFLFDGFWKEVTVSYHNQIVNGLMGTLNLLKGYTDPPGYISPRTNRRFHDLDMIKSFPILERAMTIANRLVYPDGRYLPIQDTWAFDTSSQPISGSALLPAAGIAKLERGKGKYRTQMYLTFVPKYGHNHLDPLNLVLFAEGQELLPDLGYTHTNYRSWTLSTLSHNTVVVDGRDISSSSKGSVRLFAPIDETIQVIEVCQEDAYPHVKEYRRKVLLIGINSNASYILDIFQVSGGSRHEYTLQGDANNNSTFQTHLSLKDYGPYLLPPGTDVVKPRSQYERGSAQGHYYAYAFIRDVKVAEVPDGKYDLTLVTKGGQRAKLHIIGRLQPGDNLLFLGKAPSLMPTRVLKDDSGSRHDDSFMAKMVLRREGRDLKSTFITVMEPYVDTLFNKAPYVSDVKILTPDQCMEGDVAVLITCGKSQDVILSSPLHPNKPLILDDITLNGRMGFIRMENGKVKTMYIIGGTSMRKGDAELAGWGSIEGKVLATRRMAVGDEYDAFITDVEVPLKARGHHVVVTHPDGRTHAYKIQDIAKHENGAILILDMDPGFDIGAGGYSTSAYYPRQMTWLGDHTFKIEGHASGKF